MMMQDAVMYHQSGKLNIAEGKYKKLLELLPDNSMLLTNLGAIALQKGDISNAVQFIGKSIRINPNEPNAHNNYGNALRLLKRYDEAVTSFNRAIKLKPDYADAYSNRGNALKDLKQHKEAVISFDRAIELQPDFADAYSNRGNALKDMKQLDEAVASYDKAITLNTKHTDAYYNRGNVLKNLMRFNEAVASYDKAIALNPGFANAFANRGNALQGLKQLADAISSFDRAIALKPDFAIAYSNRGNALFDLKRYHEALDSYQRAIELKSDIDFIMGNILLTRMYICHWDSYHNLLGEVKEKIENDEKVASPFSILTAMDNPDIQNKVARIYARNKFPQDNALATIEPYQKHKKIRVGYFSADFRNHPVSFLTAELYATHDRDKFEIHAFSFGQEVKDDMNNRIRTGVDYFHDVHMKSDKEIALLSRSVELDIVVDLGGYTEDSRTGIFAIRAAPIQVSYIGYLGTMGSKYMDYIIADQTIIPEEYRKYYSEKIIYLPDYQVNDAKAALPTKNLSRIEYGLPEQGFVFCCFNNTYKISPETFASWIRILKRVDGSILLLFADNESAETNLKKEAVAGGLDSNRLIFGKRLAIPEYLARYQVTNLFLDTLPYNAGTTASDALRMGLPVLTCMGSSFASRVAASLLNSLGLAELITTNHEEYESLAIELATDPDKLTSIRNKLSKNLVSSALFNTQIFARNIESAYEIINKRYQEGLRAINIYVD